MSVKNQISTHTHAHTHTRMHTQASTNWMQAHTRAHAFAHTHFLRVDFAVINKQRCGASIGFCICQHVASSRQQGGEDRWKAGGLHLNAQTKTIYMQNYCCIAYRMNAALAARQPGSEAARRRGSWVCMLGRRRCDATRLRGHIKCGASERGKRFSMQMTHIFQCQLHCHCRSPLPRCLSWLLLGSSASSERCAKCMQMQTQRRSMPSLRKQTNKYAYKPREMRNKHAHSHTHAHTHGHTRT